MTEESAVTGRQPWFSGSRRVIGYLVIFLVLAFGISISDGLRGSMRGDLTRYSLSAGRAMSRGADPYDRAEVGRNYKYTPLNAALVKPLGHLPNHVAQGIFVALGITLLLMTAEAHQRLTGQPFRWWVWGVVLLVTGRYVAHNINLAQWNLPVYTLAFLGVVLAVKRPIEGGFVTGLAAALKFMPASFIMYHLVLGRVRAAVWLVAGILFWLVAVPIAINGPSATRDHWDGFFGRAHRTAGYIMDESSVVGVSARNLVYSLLTPTTRQDLHDSTPINIVTLEPAIARGVSAGAMVVPVVLTVGLIAWRGRQRIPSGTELILTIGIMFALWILVSPNVRKANLLVLATPVFALATLLAEGSLRPWLRAVVIASLVGSGVLTGLLSSGVGGRLGIDTPMDILGAHTAQIVVLWLASMMVLATRTFEEHRSRRVESPAAEPTPPPGLLARTAQTG